MKASALCDAQGGGLCFLFPGALFPWMSTRGEYPIPKQVLAARCLVKALYRWAAPGCPIKRSKARTNAAAENARLALYTPKKANLRRGGPGRRQRKRKYGQEKLPLRRKGMEKAALSPASERL